MIWRRPTPPRPRPTRHGRHGRLGRSSVVPPPLPALESRADRFDLIVGDTAEYLRDAWPELREASFEIGAMPASADAEGIPRWSVDREAGRIIVYRLPIERLDRQPRSDDFQDRFIIEGTVFRAAAEFLGREPWDLGPDRWRR
ncbi:hypothetical protein [Microbacterium gorillae]|uniref:hypothetical protein n=1 Tax=Microbacterium gorillae TaxID=1231063 RepID=UPI001E41AC3F|nr:hypothetical protein [Microbacterium gorillae]